MTGYGGWNWWLFTIYFFWFQLLDSAEQGSGTFAQYYLDPENMKLDAEMHPSIAYLLGWREHRYRYYYYYPEYTPDFSLLDEDDSAADGKKGEKGGDRGRSGKRERGDADEKADADEKDTKDEGDADEDTKDE
mmetsp:Transcript_27259/g.36436  ORF Transcript_27259/g.36436 Transcript_27259/m.36436 type:complete len:133 (+) Transcript_27259:473-871(+)